MRAENAPPPVKGLRVKRSAGSGHSLKQMTVANTVLNKCQNVYIMERMNSNSCEHKTELFLELIVKYHPDKNNGEESTDFIRIRTAWETLR